MTPITILRMIVDVYFQIPYIYIARYCKYICNHPGVDRISGYPDILHVQCLDLVPLVILQFHVLSKLQDLQDSSINTHSHNE